MHQEVKIEGGTCDGSAISKEATAIVCGILIEENTMAVQQLNALRVKRTCVTLLWAASTLEFILNDCASCCTCRS